MNDFVRVSVEITDEKGFVAMRRNEVGTRRGELRGVSPERQAEHWIGCGREQSRRQ